MSDWNRTIIDREKRGYNRKSMSEIINIKGEMEKEKKRLHTREDLIKCMMEGAVENYKVNLRPYYRISLDSPQRSAPFISD